jgi:RanGTP-binding protein
LLSFYSSARGNTSLESAVSLTKALRWDIQSLALRLAKAANAEEVSRRSGTKVKTRVHHEAELRFIVEDIKKLLLRIEDAVPLINLAITTSGASLSTSLPTTVSPSRLLQASTFLTAGDAQFSIEPSRPVQVGPAFVLSIYMLFAGHAHRAHVGKGGIRDTTWKEAIHKARVKLIRVPLAATDDQLADSGAQQGTLSNGMRPAEADKTEDKLLLEESKANEFAYRLEIIEDLDDDRVHSFEDEEPQPGVYEDVQLAGIREFVPIHEISKIFYADTGKILNIGNEGESNSPVLLLKRDVNALPPRKMMERSEQEQIWHEEPEDLGNEGIEVTDEQAEADDPQSDIDYQIRRESFLQTSDDDHKVTQSKEAGLWRFPPNLDSEWLAFEVYTEAEDGSSGDEQDVNDDSAYASGRPSSSMRKQSNDSNFTAGLANLNLDGPTPTSASKSDREILHPSSKPVNPGLPSSPFGPIRSSLSLLEMLIRLTALQQFQQASHLSIPDELLTFFLEESSTTGAGPDGEERRRKRQEARQKVGFDPYDESPVKRRGEDYQYQNQDQDRNAYGRNSRAGTPYDDYDAGDWYPTEPCHTSRDRTGTPQSSPGEPWLLRSREHSSGAGSGARSRRNMTPADLPSSPQSPYVPPRRATRPLHHLQQARGNVNVKGNVGSPLGRGMSADTDSSLGTSPGIPEVG